MRSGSSELASSAPGRTARYHRPRHRAAELRTADPWTKYGKCLVALAYAAAVTAYQGLSGDGRIDSVEIVSVLISATTAVGVYLVPLAPRYKWIKSAVAIVLAVLQVATTAVLGGIQPDEWTLMLITAFSTVGIAVAPARSEDPAFTGEVQAETGISDS